VQQQQQNDNNNSNYNNYNNYNSNNNDNKVEQEEIAIDSQLKTPQKEMRCLTGQACRLDDARVGN
jgi:hypothetical protein